MQHKMPDAYAPTLHPDGSVSYYSFCDQVWYLWRREVPAEEMAAMPPLDRWRVQEHLDRHATPQPPTQSH